MIKIENISGRSIAPKPMSAAGALIDKHAVLSNSLSIGHSLQRATQCICGAHNAWLRAFHYSQNYAFGIMCKKCSRTAIGTTFKDALCNWKRHELLPHKGGTNA